MSGVKRQREAFAVVLASRKRTPTFRVPSRSLLVTLSVSAVNASAISDEENSTLYHEFAPNSGQIFTPNNYQNNS
jgi:hypothetical protein